MGDPIEGSKLPQLTLAHSQGGKVNIPADFMGKWTLLYFYPKDDTPGCTKQACSYRDNMSEFEGAGIAIFGVSLDDLTSHDSFSNKFSLNFPLIADTEAKLSTALGVYGDQQWGGKIFKGLARDTFLIDPQGIVRRAWRKVDPRTTVGETFEAAMALIGT